MLLALGDVGLPILVVAREPSNAAVPFDTRVALTRLIPAVRAPW